MALPPGRYADGGGLYMQVLPGGTRSWLFRYDLQRKCRWMGLGGVDAGRLADSLAQARRAAADAREQLRDGKDPLAVKRAKAAALVPARTVLFSECAEAYLAAHQSSWRSPIHARQWRQCLDDYILPVLGRLPVAGVGPGDVKRVLEPLWKTKPEVARKVAGKIGMILNFAIAREDRSTANPASLRIMRTILGPLNQKPKHHPALPWQDMPDFMRRIENRRDVPALALQWLILTATRSQEARGATWGEIDMRRKLWVIPPERMKGGVEHRVPLSLAALWVLEQMHRRTSPYVFIGQGSKPISETSLRNVLRENGLDRRTASLHGFRSTFRDWCAENGVADDVAEACLAHAVPDKVVAAYKRTVFTEARADVMLTWGLYLS